MGISTQKITEITDNRQFCDFCDFRRKGRNDNQYKPDDIDGIIQK